MSEHLQRLLFLRNRLEELLARHGPPPEAPDLGGQNLEPSWGPVGSLARRYMTEQEYDALLEVDREMIRMERSARLAREAHSQAPHVAPASEPVQPAIPEQSPPRRVLEASTAMQHIDQYGETPLFACPSCGEESAKASVPLDYWRCTACATWGKASTLGGPDRGWTTPVHVV